MSLLNYIKQNWDTTSYVNPTRMNHIEDGIYAVSNNVDNLSAEDIPYDSNNSVKDILDNSTGVRLDEAVDITSTNYLCPCDGYVVCNSGSSTSGVIRVVIADSSSQNIGFVYMNVTGSAQIQSTFVKKGMRIYLQNNTSQNGTAKFYKLKK